MKTLALFLLVTTASACSEGQPFYEGEPDPGPQPEGGVEPSFGFSERWLTCGTERCAIAAGGVDFIEIDNNGWDSVTPVFTGPFTHSGGVVHATSAGTGSIELLAIEGALERRFKTTPLRALAVGDVRLSTENAVYQHQEFVTDQIAWHTLNRVGVVELVPAGAGDTAPAYVIDASVAVGVGSDARVVEHLPGKFDLGDGTGTRTVVVEAESFGARTFEVTIVDHVERVEARVKQAPTGVGSEAIVCVDAYTGVHEVALPYSAYTWRLTNVSAQSSGSGFGPNCLKVRALAAGPATVSVDVDGQTTAVNFEIP